MKGTVAVLFGFCALAGLTPGAAAKPAPLEAPDPARGLIGVSIQVVPPAKMGSYGAVAIYFVRVVEDADRFAGESLISSTYAKGGNVYLLNAKPGRYVAVGCAFNPSQAGVAPGGTEGQGAVVFPEAAIVRTEVEVRAGGVAFMGEIVVQSSTKTKDSDVAQAHYLRMIAPRGAEQNFMARALSGNFVYTGAFKSFDRGPGPEAKLWGEATENDFKNEAAWKSRIAGRAVAPIGVAAAGTTRPKVAAEEFLSGVCVDLNTAKARTNGQVDDAEKIAHMVCQTAMTDWNSHGCREDPNQDPCKKRLGSWDAGMKSSGSSMLFAAAQGGQVAICSVMLAMGSDPNAAISTGQTPVGVAAERGDPELIQLLAKAPAAAPPAVDAGAAPSNP